MLMTTTGFAADVVSAAVRALYNQALSEQASELYYQALGLFDYEPDVPEEQLSEVTGPGKGILTIEGKQYGSNEKTKGYPVTLTLRKYTSELSWTEEDEHWLNKANSSSKRAIDFRLMPSQAVQALNQNINEDAAKVFYLGFGTTFLSVGNSEALFGSHTIKKTGASQKNTFANNHLPLTSNNLTNALTLMNRFKAQNGNQMLRVKKIKLGVATENEPDALKIIWSDYGPDNANLGLQTASIGALRKRSITIEVVTIPDIPSGFSSYWFLSDMGRAVNRAFMAWGWRPRMNEIDEHRNGTFLNESSVFFGPVIQGWQWTFGSKGDNTTT